MFLNSQQKHGKRGHFQGDGGKKLAKEQTLKLQIFIIHLFCMQCSAVHE